MIDLQNPKPRKALGWALADAKLAETGHGWRIYQREGGWFKP